MYAFGSLRTKAQLAKKPRIEETRGLESKTLAFLLERQVRPEEIAELVVFLASDRSLMITGADYIIDGGLVKTIH